MNYTGTSKRSSALFKSPKEIDHWSAPKSSKEWIILRGISKSSNRLSTGNKRSRSGRIYI